MQIDTVTRQQLDSSLNLPQMIIKLVAKQQLEGPEQDLILEILQQLLLGSYSNLCDLIITG